MTRKLILQSNLCPGDVMTMTAAVKSLHDTYPKEYVTDVRTTASEIWMHNPYITSLKADNGVELVEMEYESIHRSNSASVSFLEGYCEFLGKRIGRQLRLTVNRPCLYLAEEELKWVDQVRQHSTNGTQIPFWVMCAGVKADYTAKAWPLEYYQEVVDKTVGVIQWVQIGAREHKHPRLKGVIDLRNKTDHRQLIRLVWHAQGGLGPVTYLQHLCAAWEKPYICLLGGREPTTWVQYPLQHTLHTIGTLPCCATAACWKSRVVRSSDGKKLDESLCEWPVFGLSRPVPKCMAMIQPDEVVSLIKRINLTLV